MPELGAEKPLDRRQHVRRHDALRDRRARAARGARLRGARLPRDRHRRRVDGGARARRLPRRRARRDDDRARRRARRRRALGRAATGSRRRAQQGLPQVVSLGALDMVNFGPRESVPARFADRNLYVAQRDGHADAHDARGVPRARPPDRQEALGGARADRAVRPAPGRLRDRRARARSSTTPRRTPRCCAGSTRRSRATIERHDLDTDINDPAFAHAMADRLHELIKGARMTRDQALARLRAQLAAGNADHRRRRRHGPLGQVRRGGRHRPHHHLQLGPLPHGRPRLAVRDDALRRRQRDRRRHGARGAARRARDAGARRRLRHRPVPPDAGLPRGAASASASAASRTSRPSA